MKKNKILAALLQAVDESLDIAVSAANDARELATHEQSKPETQYDTVGLEASYLAHGQSQRVAELTLAKQQWQTLVEELENQTELTEELKLIELGALICLEDESEVSHFYLLGPANGGLTINIENKTVTVITQMSPLGKAVFEKALYDEVELNINGKLNIYEIVSIA